MADPITWYEAHVDDVTLRYAGIDADAEAFCFLRQPNRPIPARAVANRGKAAGRGTGLSRLTV